MEELTVKCNGFPMMFVTKLHPTSIRFGSLTSGRTWRDPRGRKIIDGWRYVIVPRRVVYKGKKKHLETARLDMYLEHDRKGSNTHEDCQRAFWKKYGSSEKEEIAVLTTLLLLGRMDTLGFIILRQKNQVHLLNGAQSTSYNKPSKPLYV